MIEIIEPGNSWLLWFVKIARFTRQPTVILEPRLRLLNLISHRAIGTNWIFFVNLNDRRGGEGEGLLRKKNTKIYDFCRFELLNADFIQIIHDLNFKLADLPS